MLAVRPLPLADHRSENAAGAPSRLAGIPDLLFLDRLRHLRIAALHLCRRRAERPRSERLGLRALRRRLRRRRDAFCAGAFCSSFERVFPAFRRALESSSPALAFDGGVRLLRIDLELEAALLGGVFADFLTVGGLASSSNTGFPTGGRVTRSVAECRSARASLIGASSEAERITQPPS